MRFTGFNSARAMGPEENFPLTDVCALRYDHIFMRWIKRCETENDSGCWIKRTQLPCATSPIHARLFSFKSVTCESGTSRRVNEVWWDKSVFGTCCLQVTVRWRTAVMKRLSPWQQAPTKPPGSFIYKKKRKRKLQQPRSGCSDCTQPFKL